jgi:hypothetical protein
VLEITLFDAIFVIPLSPTVYVTWINRSGEESTSTKPLASRARVTIPA